MGWSATLCLGLTYVLRSTTLLDLTFEPRHVDFLASPLPLTAPSRPYVRLKLQV